MVPESLRPALPQMALDEIEREFAPHLDTYDSASLFKMAIMAEAAQLQRTRAAERGAEALQRVELLRLRFEENLPVRAIAGYLATFNT